RNTIVAANVAPGASPHACAGTVGAGGADVCGAVTGAAFNLVGTATGSSGFGGSDLLNPNPLLGALQVNAPSAVASHALLAGSPAIDGGNPATPLDGESGRCAATDQRGVARPVAARCDIGAFELRQPSVTLTDGTVTYTEGAAPVQIDAALTASSETPNASSATVQITANYANGQDVLGVAAALPSGITSNFNAANGTLTLSGTATVAAYQQALQLVTYANTSENPSNDLRTVTVLLQAGTTGPASTRTVQVVPQNDTPIAQPQTYNVTAGTTLQTAAPGVLTGASDPDSPTLTASLVAPPPQGTLALQPDGAFTYTPQSTQSGPVSFTYRASDGAAQSSPATVSINVVATACVPRPRVRPEPIAGGGGLTVSVQSTPLNTHQNNPLQQIRFGQLQNATVTYLGQPITSGQTITAPASTVGLEFQVRRTAPGQPTMVPFTVVDGCGEWPTFVGGGVNAGF
ncbi:MAG: cadherin-like domain-containing protein, partial [Solirubrobacterales bacterium]|nr:cadherin-like domain-containing protein [Solirubrobacterales bacterium]